MNFKEIQGEIMPLIGRFPTEGTILQSGRNTIKKIEYNGQPVAVKSFKKPNFFNTFAYKYIRKSKAKRSYEYAHRLLALGINTPRPIGFFQRSTLFGITDSYYVCEHLPDAVTLKVMLSRNSLCKNEHVLKQYVAFVFDLHQKGIEFIDSTPGNILVEELNIHKYRFSLIDLNRMKFHRTPLTFLDRMKNLSKLTDETPLIHHIGHLYAKIYNQDKDPVYQAILYYRSRYNVHAFHKKILKCRMYMLIRIISPVS